MKYGKTCKISSMLKIPRCPTDLGKFLSLHHTSVPGVLFPTIHGANAICLLFLLIAGETQVQVSITATIHQCKHQTVGEIEVKGCGKKTLNRKAKKAKKAKKAICFRFILKNYEFGCNIISVPFQMFYL